MRCLALPVGTWIHWIPLLFLVLKTVRKSREIIWAPRCSPNLWIKLCLSLGHPPCLTVICTNFDTHGPPWEWSESPASGRITHPLGTLPDGHGAFHRFPLLLEAIPQKHVFCFEHQVVADWSLYLEESMVKSRNKTKELAVSWHAVRMLAFPTQHIYIGIVQALTNFSCSSHPKMLLCCNTSHISDRNCMMFNTLMFCCFHFFHFHRVTWCIVGSVPYVALPRC